MSKSSARSRTILFTCCGQLPWKRSRRAAKRQRPGCWRQLRPLIEDHSFPDPQWASALVATLQQGWDGAGPLVKNANPHAATSWVNFVLAYGQLSYGQSGERALIPWHNSAYRREALLPLQNQLGALLEWEGWLQSALRARGGRLYFETGATTAHLNVSRPLASLKLNYIRGRALGATRCEREHWSRSQRYVHAAAVVLSPIVNLRSCHPALRNARLTLHRFAGVVAALIPNLVALAVGEAVGIMGGIGQSVDALESFELYRARYVLPSERAQMLSTMTRFHMVQLTGP